MQVLASMPLGVVEWVTLLTFLLIAFIVIEAAKYRNKNE